MGKIWGLIALSTVVRNSRDRHEKHAYTTHNILYPKNRLKCIDNTIITLKLCENPNDAIRREFQIYQYFV